MYVLIHTGGITVRKYWNRKLTVISYIGVTNGREQNCECSDDLL
jgi:hypothetical protein